MNSLDIRLPAPPQIAAKVIELAADPRTTLKDLAQVANACPPFAVELLRVANSPAFSTGGAPVRSTDRAVSKLGIRSLRNLALCWSAKNCINPKEVESFDLDRFWEDSLRRAAAAELLAEALDVGNPVECFTAGLLQDLGVLVLMLNYKDKAKEWMSYVDAPPDARRAIERELFQETHDEIASGLRQAWQLPDTIFDVMQQHHDAWDQSLPPVVKVCRWAECLSSLLVVSDKKRALSLLRRQLGEEAQLDDATINHLTQDLSERVQTRGASMGLSVSSQPTFEEILGAANRSLADMNLNYEQLIRELEATKAELEASLAEKRTLAKELATKNEKLQTLSITDTLTDLPNRRGYAARAQDELARIARNGQSMCLLMADIDHFKSVNDNWGHDYGDKVIAYVANVIRSSLRCTDFAARFGGEEFAVLLPETSLEGAVIAAEKIMDRLRKRKLVRPDQSRGHITISMGAAVIKGPCRVSLDPLECLERLYKAADSALYKSKQNGRNQVSTHDIAIPMNPDVQRQAA